MEGAEGCGPSARGNGGNRCQEGTMGRLTGTTARTAAVCGAAVLALAGFAGGGTGGDPATPESAAHTTLLALNTGEAEEGQLAVQMAAHARVRDFAQTMVTQH